MTVPDNINVLRIRHSDFDNNGIEFLIYPIEAVDTRQSKSAMSIALPGQSPTANILMGVSGMEREISVQAFLWDDGEDRAPGYIDDIITVEDQMEYLQDTVHDEDFSAGWEITLYSEYDTETFLLDGVSVHIENIDFTICSIDGPKWLGCRIDMIVGETIG